MLTVYTWILCLHLCKLTIFQIINFKNAKFVIIHLQKYSEKFYFYCKITYTFAFVYNVHERWRSPIVE